MTHHAMGHGAPQTACEAEPKFSIDDDPFERIEAALLALRAISSLVAGGVPPHQLSHVQSIDLALLIDLVGREIDTANQTQHHTLLAREPRHEH